MKVFKDLRPVTLALAVPLLVACAGSAGKGSSRPGNGPGPGGESTANSGTGGAGAGSGGSGAGQATGGDASVGAGGSSVQGGPLPGIRRLSHKEYNYTVLDVLGTPSVVVEGEVVRSGPASGFQADSVVDGYDNFRSVLGVTAPLAGQYATAALALATEARTTGKLPACAGAEATCVEGFVQGFGQALYRRPVSAEEVGRLLGFFQAERAQSSYEESLQLLLETMLQAPQFLYRSEYGVAGAAGARVLTDYEVASALSYLFWSRPPDAELMGAAASARLGTAGAREAQARRLLGSPRAWEQLQHFLIQWVDTTKLPSVFKDPAVYPEFDAAMRQGMLDGQAAFLRGTVWDADASVGRLLAGDAGLLTQPWLLTVHSHPTESFPIARGKFVRTRLLCQDLPPPPDNIVIEPVERNPNATTRERFAQHSTNVACSGCHSLIDPVGFGFERYDGIGRYRTEENGLPVDDSGELTATEDANGPFKGPGELGTRLSGSAEVQRCVARQVYRYAFGAREDAAVLESLRPVLAEFQASSFNVRELFVLLAKSEAFVTRVSNP